MKYSHVRTHFKQVDPVIYPIIKSLDFADLIKPRDKSQYFASLCREIIGQQLSGQAADTIENRFLNLVSTAPTPQIVLKFSDQALRDVGLSWAKVKYLKDLSSKVLSSTLDLHTI